MCKIAVEMMTRGNRPSLNTPRKVMRYFTGNLSLRYIESRWREKTQLLYGDLKGATRRIIDTNEFETIPSLSGQAGKYTRRSINQYCIAVSSSSIALMATSPLCPSLLRNDLNDDLQRTIKKWSQYYERTISS